MMKTSQRGIDLIKSFEGLSLTAYPDPGTGADPWTIGYGHTKGVKQGMKITENWAEELLRDDLAEFEAAVNGMVKVRLCQHQFDALVSLTFNIGASAFSDSTLLRLLNSGMYDDAALQFQRWNRAGGNVLAGLTRRRMAERKLFEDEQ
ncbi:MAG TPA: muraminidase [Pseudomonas sp.]|nr:muraminidase [Pseudomonas sp.]